MDKSQIVAVAIALTLLMMPILLVVTSYKWWSLQKLARATQTSLDEKSALNAKALTAIKALQMAKSEADSRVEYLEGRFGGLVDLDGESVRLGHVITALNSEIDELRASYKDKKQTYDRMVAELAIFDERLAFAEMGVYRIAKNMAKPVQDRRRCWTLEYADGAQFHMDIVPALPNAAGQRLLLETRGLDTRWAGTAITITDNETWNYEIISEDWPRSNPRGYADWFKSRMAGVFEKRRRVLAESRRAAIESIPDYKIRTPLQSAIMILKRHRDIMFDGRSDARPISIIITTLAAHAYNGEETIGRALVSILARMDQFIHNDGKKIHRLEPDRSAREFCRQVGGSPRAS